MLRIRVSWRRGALCRLAAGIALLVAVPAWGGDLAFRRLTVRDGLSQSSVYCVLQDRQGFLWVGTQDGLNRYDGNRFRVFRADPDDEGSLSNDVVTSLAEDRSGFLWVGSLRGGLNRYDPRSDRFLRFRHSADPRSLSADKVYTVFVDRSGVVWAGTSGGLNRYDPATGSFTRYTHDPKDPGSISADKALSIAEDGEGRLWVGTIGGGLCRLDRERRTFARYAADPGSPGRLASDWITSLLVDATGTLWVGTKGGGLSRYAPGTDSFVTFRHDPREPSSLSSDMIWSLGEAPLRPGVLWIGTFGGGLCRFDTDSGTFERFSHDPADPASLGEDQVTAIRQDRGGVLWIGTWTNGLSRADLAAKRFTNHRSGPGGGLTNEVVFGLLEDERGVLWVGTYGGGLCAGYPGPGGGRTFRCFRTSPTVRTTISNDVVTEVFEDRQRRLWIGTNGGGLNLLDREKGTFTRYGLRAADAKNPATDVVFAMTEDPDGQLLVGTEARGLVRFDPSTGSSAHGYSLTPERNEIDGATVVQFLWDRAGKLWMVPGEGHALFRWDPSSRRLDRFDPRSKGRSPGKSLVLYEDQGGTLWLGLGDTLARFDPKTRSSVPRVVPEALGIRAINGIVEGADGNLWLGTNNGLVRFDVRQESFRRFDQDDGVQSLEFNHVACASSRAGELFFGGTEGVTAFDPRRIRDNPYAPPVAITGMRSGNEALRTATAFPWLDRIRLPYGAGVISVDVAALDFARPERNRIAYRIDGVTKEWIDAGGQSRIGLGHLGPGEHVLRVKARSPDGVWSRKEASLRIVVVPPFWRRGWFLALAALAFAGASYAVIAVTRRYLSLVAFWKTRTYVGHYRILGTLGSGGMGVVYRAADVVDRSRLCALKVLREEYTDDVVLRRRLLNEAALIDQLDHPNIVKVIERGEANGRLFIAMELLSGVPLSERIAEGRALPLPACLRVMRGLAEAVERVHARGIVHRDLKPANVMLVPSDEEETVKLLDFGLARGQSLTRLTETGMIVGSINYLAPEQIRDRAYTPASDVYSLGVTFYELVALEKPFLGETAADVIKQILDREPLPPSAFRPDLPERLNALILSMLAKGPEARPTALAVSEELLIATDEAGSAWTAPVPAGAPA